MHFLKAFLKYGLLFLFFLINTTSGSPQKLSELKSKITTKDFPHSVLADYEFDLLNNKIDFENELKYLSKLNPSFETNYLKSFLLFRNGEFNKSFNELNSLLQQAPKYYPYYDLLVKVKNIVGDTSNVESSIPTNIAPEYKNYLMAKLAYTNGEYKNAKDLFSEVLKTDSTSYYPNFMIAYTYRNLGKYNVALKYFNKAVAKFKKESPQSAKVRIAIGSIFYLSGNYAKAKELYNSGLEIATNTKYNTEKINALLNTGMILDLEGDVSTARKNFEEATNLATDIGDAELGATVLSEYAVSLTYTGEEVNARKKYEESFLLFKKQNNKKRLALTAINIGNSYLNISNYKSAIKYFVIGLNEAGENARTQMLALRGLGDVYTNLADYSKALHYYEKAKNIAKEIEDIAADAEINIGLGVLYYNIDMPSMALKLLEESENKLIDSNNPYLKLEVEQKIGIIYSSLDSLSLASTYLEKSAKLAQKYGDIYSEILSNTFLADIKIREDKLKEATALLNTSMDVAKSIGYSQIEGIQNILLSDVSKAELNKAKQIKHLRTAMIFAKNSNDINTLIRANKKLGQIFENEHNFGRAEEHYLSAISLIEKNSNRLFSKADIQIKFFSNYYTIYNSLTQIYITEKRYKEAFEILERAKGRNTNQNLVELQLGNSVESEELLTNYYDLEWKLTSGLYSNKEIEIINEEFKSVKNKIAKINPETGKYFNNEGDILLSSIKKNLDENQYIISFFVEQNDIYAFKLSQDDLIVKEINVSKNELYELKKMISPYYDENIGVSEITFNKDLFAFNANGSKEFYDKILRPIISDIPINSKIIFSLPTEMLTLPFELLVTSSDANSSPYLLDDKRFLINDYNISYIPSALIWSKLKAEKTSSIKGALLIGNPFFDNQSNSVASVRGIADEIDITSRSMEHLRLEYSEDEILSIGSLISDEKIYLSENATETTFKNNVEDAAIVHLSTHSILYKSSPLILFSNVDKENDGFLEVGEILNLKSEMVVLSSCKSGLGKVDKAEGIVGMQKAFFDAGAKSVVVSLWDVNDKYTSVFMKYFYSFLSDGISKSKALRLAKIKFIKEKNPNPYYWAAFTLAGKDAPIRIPTKTNIMSYSIGLFLFFIIMVYFILQQKRRKKYFLKMFNN